MSRLDAPALKGSAKECFVAYLPVPSSPLIE